MIYIKPSRKVYFEGGLGSCLSYGEILQGALLKQSKTGAIIHMGL